MTLYRADGHWSDSSLILSLHTLPSNDTWGTLLNLTTPIILTSTSLDRLSFTDPTPYFPPGHRPPLFTLIDTQEKHRDMVGGKSHVLPCEEHVLLTVPTIPRMKALLEEKIVVDNWKVEVWPQTLPDHVPWGGIEPTGRSSEENSKSLDSYPSSAYGALDPSQYSGPLTRKTSTRNPLVLDHEITCKYEKVTKPRNNVGPESAPAFAHGQSGVQQVAHIDHSQHEEKYSPGLAFYPITPKRHLNLAVRRGHQAFPSLKISQASRNKRDATPFDSIPSAFRGSPTPYCPPAFHQVCRPASRNVAFAEMFAKAREKCASFSLPADWFYRPRSQSTKLSDTASSVSQSDEDEWAFAEPLMDMINSFSAQVDDSSAHSIAPKDDFVDLPVPSCRPCDDGPVVGHNRAKQFSKPSDSPANISLVRPSLINPCSHRPASRRARKTVRFADTPTLLSPEDRLGTVPGANSVSKSFASSPPRHHKRQSISLSAWTPTPPLSVVKSLQSAKPPRNSWTSALQSCSFRSPPPPPRRPLSHRYPKSPKLPSFTFTDGNTITRTLSGSPIRQFHTYLPPSDIVGKSPITPTQPFGKQPFIMKAKKNHTNKENLKISHPIPITAIPRHKQNSSRGGGGGMVGSKNHVTSPLRNILMKFK